MISANGEESTEKWAKNFLENFARPPKGGDRDQIKGAASGQCDIAIANTYYLAGMLNSKDEKQRLAAKKIAVFWPNQNGRGAHVNISGAALTRSAKNKDNAIKLIEFLSQKDSQEWYGKVNGEYPVVKGIKASAILNSWGDFKADTHKNLSILGELNPTAVMLMDRVGWK
jgi:iron(III) transport system substrate-binding protein